MMTWSLVETGTPAGIRTRDLRIRSPLLYPAELLAHACKRMARTNAFPRSCQVKESFPLAVSAHITGDSVILIAAPFVVALAKFQGIEVATGV